MGRCFILLFFVIYLFYNNHSFAQVGVIKGTVIASGEKVTAATVSLLRDTDSAWIRSELTDDKGSFTFTDVLAADYIISVSSVGFITALKKVNVKDNADAEYTFDLQKRDTALTEITVSAKKTFIEMSLGKMIVNVDGSPTTAGANALDLLRRLPGLMVSPDGTISINGKQGVLILIDDRPTYLSEDQLAEYLRTITSDEISQMELITQPGAKYDASGNTGVINIKMKKSKKKGFNGNMMLSLGQGVYPVEHSSLLLNYRKNKLSLLLSASDLEAKGFGDWTETQYSIDPATGAVTGTSKLHSTPWERFGVSTIRLAADYNWTGQTTIGASARGTYHPNSSYGYTSSFSTDNTGTKYNENMTPDGFIRKDVVANAYLTHKFTKQSTLDVNADYLAYGNYARQDVNSQSNDSQMRPLPDPLILHSRQQSLINVWSIKADEVAILNNGLKLESGLKSSYVTTDNNAMFTIFRDNALTDDTMRTNHFLYRENINAAYASLDKIFDSKWETKLGLRAEQTNAAGIQYVHDSRFGRNYLSLFPTGFTTYKADSNNQFELNYGRRIDRPGYRWLNPFIYYSLQYNYSVGNPFLLPQYTNNIELKHSYKNMLITAVSFSSTTNVISDVLVVDSATKKVYSTHRNIDAHKTADYHIIFNRDLFKWCTINAGGYVFYSVYSGLLTGKNVIHEGVGYSIHFSTQFDPGKDWKIGANGYYENRSIPSLIETYGAQLYMEFGISKKIRKDIQIKLSAYDPFYLYRLYIHNRMDDFRSDAVFRNGTQQIALEFSYSFGKKQSESQRKNTLDESDRIK